jgi:hypothetical protein
MYVIMLVIYFAESSSINPNKIYMIHTFIQPLDQLSSIHPTCMYALHGLDRTEQACMIYAWQAMHMHSICLLFRNYDIYI